MARRYWSAVVVAALVVGIISTVQAQLLPIPGLATDTVIQSQEQQQRQSQPQRLSPRNQMFLSPVGQPQRYDAVTINRYIMGYPSTQYRVRPVVRTPMYQVPGQ